MDRYFLANCDNMGKEKWFFSTTPVVYSLGLVWELSCNGLIQLYSRILEINHLLTQTVFSMLVDNYSTTFFLCGT